jgi:hypothetical protein
MPRTLMIAFSTLGICLSCTQLANAQESFRQLMRNQNVLGFRMSFANEGRIIGGALEHVTSADTTLTAAAGIGLFDSTSDFEFSPAPVLAVAVGRKVKPETEPLGYFTYLAFGVSSVRSHFKRTSELFSTSLSFGPSANAGVFKPVELTPEFIVNLFFQLSFLYSWTSIGHEYRDLNFRDPDITVRESEFSGMTGVELDVSPKYSIYFAFNFSFDKPKTSVSLGVNFF